MTDEERRALKTRVRESSKALGDALAACMESRDETLAKWAINGMGEFANGLLKAAVLGYIEIQERKKAS